VKVLLDSNVLVAALATRGLCAALFETCLKSHQIIGTDQILDEVQKALAEKVKLPALLVMGIRKYLLSEWTQVTPEDVAPTSCRDPTDLSILGAALSGKADAIVTGDMGLLVLKSFQGIPIFTPREFWARLTSGISGQ